MRQPAVRGASVCERKRIEATSAAAASSDLHAVDGSSVDSDDVVVVGARGGS